MNASEAPVPIPHGVKPPGAKEFTFRSAIVAIVVAAVIGGSYPYVVLKLGFGPNISVVSAFFGYLALGHRVPQLPSLGEQHRADRRHLGRADGVPLHADGGVRPACAWTPAANFTFVLQPHQAFMWLTCSGVLGVLLSVPMRRHFVVDEKLTFADGVAAAETLVVLDSKGERIEGRGARDGDRRRAVRACSSTIREDARLLGQLWYRVPEMLPLGPTGARMNVGISWSLLSIGSGMLVGIRITTSMVLGMMLAWVIAPPLLLERGWVAELVRREILLWVMWPAVGMLVAGGLTALVLRWNVLVKSFRGLRSASVGAGRVPDARG